MLDSSWGVAGEPQKGGRLVGKGGLEPPTLRLSGVYSYQLSYLPRMANQGNAGVDPPP